MVGHRLDVGGALLCCSINEFVGRVEEQLDASSRCASMTSGSVTRRVNDVRARRLGSAEKTHRIRAEPASVLSSS